MKKLKRSLSLRSSQRRIPESCRPQVWENDSYKVRNGGVNFPVKYVGCIEVPESRGTQVCSEAFRRLKESSTAKKKRMTLLVTADCIRLVDDETKSLVVDQTIEKVSFCTPDPSNDRVFSYICREGTTRRWMCHCFLAIRDTMTNKGNAQKQLKKEINDELKLQIAEIQYEFKKLENRMALLPNLKNYEYVVFLIIEYDNMRVEKVNKSSLQKDLYQLSCRLEEISTKVYHIDETLEFGERLSHAVGCAFTACLQRKQKAQALQQQHQAQKQKEAEAGKTNTESSGAPVVNGSSPAPTQPQTQAQLAAQPVSSAVVQPTVTATTTPVSPAAVTSPTVRASSNTVQAPTSQQPENSASIMSNITTQPVLKPPPPTSRARPQAFNPSPFTRHMSLRYRSNPLTFTPLKEGGGYETLAEETLSPVPRLPPTVDALIPDSGSASTSTTLAAGTFDPAPGPQRVLQQQPATAISSQPPHVFNAFGPPHPTQLANPASQSAADSWQPFNAPLQPIAAAQGNVWASNRGHQPLTHKVSDAENWLATVQADTKAITNGTGGNQGLLTTANPFGNTAAQLDALSSAWTKDIAAQLPNASAKPSVAPTGSVAKTSWPNQGDDLSSLSTHHTTSPQPSNPFGQNKQTFWV